MPRPPEGPTDPDILAAGGFPLRSAACPHVAAHVPILVARGFFPTAVVIALFAAAFPFPASGEDTTGYGLDGTEAPPAGPDLMVEGGTALAIASDLGAQPQLGCFRDLGSWQLGLQVRIAPAHARSGYDYLPQTNLQVRKSWLGDGDTGAVRNSEYFGLSLGGFFAYNFNGEKAGLKPYGSLTLGKYWMPFENTPFGLDLNLELTRYLSGHLPTRSETTYVTLGLHLFYQVP